MRVLVLRNDKIGDFTLALPVFEVLRRGLPGAELTAFVPEYTRALAQLSPFVDRIEIDPDAGEPGGSPRALARRWGELDYAAMLALWSHPRTALAGLLARIPVRVAPATKWHQWMHNDRVVQRRSRSTRPEHEYNVELACRLVERLGGSATAEFSRPVLRLDASLVAARRDELRARSSLAPEAALVVVHPGHGGSSSNLTLDQYAELLRALRSRTGHAVLVTAGPAEAEGARALSERIADLPHAVLHSTGGLAEFCAVLAAADLFIGSSTGPLHLAGALDRPTAGFYVSRRTGSSLRWQTLNSPERRISFEPPAGAPERDLGTIDLCAAAAQISERFLGA